MSSDGSDSFAISDEWTDADPSSELIRQAELFEDQLRTDGKADWPGGLDHSRIAKVLQLLNATLVPGSTRSLSTANDERPPNMIPPTVGRFSVGELLGQGGFGAVYKAHDTVLHRDVALKAVPRRLSMETVTDESHLREARAAARLNHPSLVPLYEVLEDEKYLYLISEFCDGPTLAEYLELTGERLKPAWAAEITLRLAQGIAHAHGRGLVHRDIKPSNVLLAPEHAESDLLPFTPRLTDFGLVLDADNDPVEYGRQRLVGTILYIPPEQLLGSDGVDARCGDVYTLGLLLYQMLARRLPYRSTNAMDRFQEICTAPIPRIEVGEHAISRDLHAIYLKALAKRPEQRYSSAQLLADDLMRYRDGREVTARPQSSFERVYRAVHRAPLLSGLLFAFVAMTLLSAGAFAWNNRQLRVQSGELRHALASASTSRGEAIHTAYLSDMNQAFLAVAKNDPATAISVIGGIRQYADQTYRQRFDLRLLQSLAGEGWTALDAFDSGIEEIVPLPKSDQFIVAGGNVLRLYRSGTRKPVREVKLAAGAMIHALAAAPDGDLLAVGVSGVGGWSWTGGSSDTVQFLSLSGLPVPQPLYGFNATVDSLAFSGDGKRIVVGARYEPLEVIDIAGEAKRRPIPSTRRNEDLTYGPDEELLWMPEAGRIQVHDLDACAVKRVYELPAVSNYRRLHRSADGRWIVATLHNRSDGFLYDLHRQSSEPIVLKNPHGELFSIRISDNGKFVAAGTLGGGVVAWALDAEQLDAKQLDGEANHVELTKHHSIHNGPVNAIGVDDAGTIFSGAIDGSLAVSSILDSREGRQTHSVYARSNVADLIPDTSTSIVGCRDGSVWSVDLASRKQICIHDPTNVEVTAVAVSQDGRYVAVGWESGAASITELGPKPNWYPLPTDKILDAETQTVSFLEFNPSATRLSLCRGSSRLQWLNLTYPSVNNVAFVAETAAEAHAPTSVEAIAVLDDRTALLLSDTIRVWSAESKSFPPAQVGLRGVHCQCFDRNTRKIYVGCLDGRIRTLDSDGKLLATSQRWTPTVVSPQVARQIKAIAISPDSRSLLTGSDIGDVAVWDAQSLRYLGPIWQGDFGGEIERIRVVQSNDLIFVHQRVFPTVDAKSDGKLRWLRLEPLPGGI